MEKNTSSSSKSSSKPVGSSSSGLGSSSFINTLFGPEPSHPSSGSSSNILGSVFGPPSMGGIRDGQAGSGKHGAHGKGGKGENSKNNAYNQQGTNDLCLYSNSIYYGGQDVYPPPSRNTDSQLTYKKDDQQEGVPGVDTRGNWWQGSYYY